jgi:hypothetical protein
VKERPILFSAPMVRAILEDRKTQTRRVVKPQPFIAELSSGDLDGELVKRPHWCIDLEDDRKRSAWPVGEEPYWTHCPYGKPGDRLWVRETWTGTWHETCGSENMHIAYAADGGEKFVIAPKDYVLPKAAAKVSGWVSPLFIRRFASRILLEITDVRVQRLQDISEEDAIAEGADPIAEEVSSDLSIRYRAAFHSLWSRINGIGSWSANPWVWAITFKRIEAAERAV